MKNYVRRRLSLLLACVMMGSFLAGCAVSEPEATTAVPTTAAETTQPTSPPTEAVTEPTEATTEPTQAPTEPYQWPEEGPWLYAGRAFVFDCKEQSYRYVYGDLQQRVYPASITKLMCAMVACKYLPRDYEITVGEEIYMIAKKASTAGLQEGDVITVENVMKALLIPSGCEAAYVLAKNAGQIIAQDPELGMYDAVDLFVEHMNLLAQELGLKDSHFMSPDGRHNENHYVSMEDFVTIGQAVLDYSLIMETVGQSHAVVELVNGEAFEVESTNPHLDENSEYYIPTCIGLKTGSHYKSMQCLLSGYWVEDRYVLIGVFGSYDGDARATDICNLYEMYGEFPEE